VKERANVEFESKVMYVKKGDINSVFKALGSAIVELKVDTVMLPKNGRLRPVKMYYHNESVGWGSFLLSEANTSRFVAVDAGTLFTLLQGLDASWLPGRPVVRAGFASRDLIDLSSMLEDIAIVGDIHFAVNQLWKKSGHNNGPDRSEIPSEVLDGIKTDLRTLCKDDYGVKEAKRLWAIYEPVLGPEAPNLAVGVGHWIGAGSMENRSRREVRPGGGSDQKPRDGVKKQGSRKH
jgi:hypothetical protein